MEFSDLVPPYNKDPDERFEYVRYLGEGSYGYVELCKDRDNGNKYVCRKIANIPDSNREEKAQAEIMALNDFRHMHIINFITYYQTVVDQSIIDRNHSEKIVFKLGNPIYCVIIEFMDKGDLECIMKKRNSIEEIILLKFMSQAIKAFEYLDQNNKLHRDIKPGNIFLNKYGDIKLGDFGEIRYSLQGESYFRNTGQHGTPEFFSPEMKEPHLFENIYSVRSDIYSLGKTFLLACDFSKRESVAQYKDGPLSIPEQYSKMFGNLLKEMLEYQPYVRINLLRLKDKLNQIITPQKLEETKQNEIADSLKLFYGKNGDSNEKEATNKLKKLIQDTKMECPEPAYQLAQCYLYSKDINAESAIRYLRTAALKQYAPALKLLALCYQYGFEIEKDMLTSTLLLTIAQTNDPEASFLLGIIYYDNLNSNGQNDSKSSVEQDFDLAFHYFSQAKSLAPAQNYLGLCYLNGNGTKKNIFEAYRYFDLSASNGSIDGMYNLAEFYLNNNSDDQSIEKAINLLTEAANQYHIGASIKLSELYSQGKHKNEKKASYYSKIGSEGNKSYDRLYSYALLKMKGSNEIEKNGLEAFMHFNICSQNHHPGATYRLSQCYRDGIGKSKDEIKAKEFLEQSSKENIIDATIDLALSQNDEEQKIKLLTEASDFGSPRSSYILAKLYIDSNKDEPKKYESRIADLLRYAHYGGITDATYLLAHNIKEHKIDGTEREAYDLYEVAAMKNHIEAAYELGMIYSKTYIGHIDNYKAFSLFEIAANQNHIKAMVELANLYEHGLGTYQNPEKAFELYQEAAIHGDMQGIYHLGLCYMNGFGVDRIDYKKAKALFEEVLNEIPNAKCKLGCIYYKGANKDIDTAAKLFEEASNQGDAEAKYYLGKYYLKYYKRSNNSNTKFNPENQAYKLFEESSKKGYNQAAYRLAKAYQKGIGQYNDINQAIEIYKALIRRECHVKSLYRLGHLYTTRFDRTSTECKRGIQLLEYAADKKNSDAMNALGLCYYNGKGVEVNYQKAAELFEKAIITDNNLFGKVYLGQCYIEGHGVGKLQEKGYKLLQEAANENDSAKLRIGICLYSGAGVNQDIIGGLKLIKEAALNNEMNAMCYYAKLIKSGKIENDVGWNLLEIFEELAKKGLPEAMFQLGCIYENGELKDVCKNDILAEGYYKNSSDAGLVKGLYHYGLMKLKSDDKDEINKGIDLIKEAAKYNNVEANIKLSEIYKEGTLVLPDEKQAEIYKNTANRLESFGKEILDSKFPSRPVEVPRRRIIKPPRGLPRPPH